MLLRVVSLSALTSLSILPGCVAEEPEPEVVALPETPAPEALPPEPEPPPTPEDFLAVVDAVLSEVGGERTESERELCAMGGPTVGNRQFLCDRSEPVGTWSLTAPHPPGRPVSVTLSVRRMHSPEAATEAQTIALTRYGGDTAGPFEGGLAWCDVALAWQGELLWGLDSGCHISHYVTWAHDLKARLIALGDVFSGAAAIRGTQGGWSGLVDGAGRRATITDRRLRFARVVGVADDDVLWIREQPPFGTNLRTKVDSLASDATCVPVYYHSLEDHGWWRVQGPEAEGWASPRYLEMTDPSTCLTGSGSPPPSAQ